MMDFSWSALLLSLKVAGYSVLINFFITVPIGFLLARKNFIGKEILDTILTLPMVMPPTVLGYYLLVLLGRHGWIGKVLEKYFSINLIFTWQGAVIAATIVTLPLVFKPTRTAFESVNPCYEQAARVLGVSDFSIFFRIIFPLAWRGIFAGLLLAFARSLGEFGATLMVAGSTPGATETLSTAIYTAVQEGNDHTAAIAVIVLSLVCISVLFIAKKLIGHKIFY